MLLLLTAAARAAVLVGAAWAPPGVGALAWSDAEAFSGTLAGEFDGLLRPPLTAHVGFIGGHDAVLAGFALVCFGTTALSDGVSIQNVGGTRLGLDYRRYLSTREAGRVGLYGDVGGYGIIANSRDVNDAYTQEEQEDANESAEGIRARIGGIGWQVGLGAEYLFGDKEQRPAVAVGLRYLARGHHGQITDEEGTTVSSVVLSEAALVLEFMR